MTKEMLKKLSQLIDLLSLKEAIEEGVDIESREFQLIVNRLKELVARKYGLTASQLENIEKGTERSVDSLAHKQRRIEQNLREIKSLSHQESKIYPDERQAGKRADKVLRRSKHRKESESKTPRSKEVAAIYIKGRK